MDTAFDLGSSPLPGKLAGRVDLVFRSDQHLPSLRVTCVEGDWEEVYADLTGHDERSEHLADWEIYVSAQPHNRPVASAIFAGGIFELTGRCSGDGEIDAFIWRIRPNLLDAQVRDAIARRAGWMHAATRRATFPTSVIGGSVESINRAPPLAGLAAFGPPAWIEDAHSLTERDRPRCFA